MRAGKVLRSAFALGIVGTGISGGAAAADIYNACSDNGTRQIRPSSIQVNTAAACTNKETARTWNETGPQGPQGLPGPQGPAGPSAVYIESGQPLLSLPVSPDFSNPNYLDVATIDLPGGVHAITATVNRIWNTSANPDDIADASCVLGSFDGAHVANAVASRATLGLRQTTALTVTAVAHSAAPKTYRLRCANLAPVGVVGVGEYSIMAIKVGGFFQP